MHKFFILLTLVFILNVALRSIFVNSLPPSLNWDEVSHGYNAYSILQTGKDEWGTALPLIFRAYGDYKLPLYIYLTVPFVFLLGLNPFSVRLVSILSGSLLPIILFLIAQKYLSKKASLIVCLIASLSPWSIFLSRIALEANLFTLLVLTSFYLLLTNKIFYSTLFYSLSLLTYNSSRVYLPFYLLLLLLAFLKSKTKSALNIKQYIFLAATIFIVILQTLNTEGQARYKWVSILDIGAINRINELQQTCPRLLVNKYTYFAYTSAQNYLSHFNPNYIYNQGSSNYQFNIPDFYLIHPFFLLFFIIGLISLLREKSFHHHVLLLFFLIAPIPSAITRDAPHILRSLVFLPLSTIIIGLGVNVILTKFKKLSLPIYIVFFAILGVTQVQFWNAYHNYSLTQSSSWQYGYQQMVSYLKSEYNNYDNIYITKKYGEPHEFILFFWPYDPKTYINDPNKVTKYHTDWYWVQSFDKFNFVNDWEIKDLTLGKQDLLITSPGNYNNSNSHITHTIYDPNKSPVFELITFEKASD